MNSQSTQQPRTQQKTNAKDLFPPFSVSPANPAAWTNGEAEPAALMPTVQALATATPAASSLPHWVGLLQTKHRYGLQTGSPTNQTQVRSTDWISYKPNTGKVYRLDLLQTKHRYGLQTGSSTNQTQVRSTDWISYKPNTGMVYRLDLLQTRHRYGLQTGCPTNQRQVYLQTGFSTNQTQVWSTEWISYKPKTSMVYRLHLLQAKDRYGLQTASPTNQTHVWSTEWISYKTKHG